MGMICTTAAFSPPTESSRCRTVCTAVELNTTTTTGKHAFSTNREHLYIAAVYTGMYLMCSLLRIVIRGVVL